jgi:hypothetical protein
MIFHGIKSEMEDFHNKLEEFTSKNYMENGFGTTWLGNIVCGAGLGDRVDSKENRLRCRGNVTYLGDLSGFEEYKPDQDVCFQVDTNTAWAPMSKMWVEVIKALGYKTIGFSYQAEECGCELYQTYDPYGEFDDKYYVDCFFDGEDENNRELMVFDDIRYFSTDEQLIEKLQTLLGTEETDLDILKERVKKYPFKSEDSYIFIHEYDILDEYRFKEYMDEE